MNNEKRILKLYLDPDEPFAFAPIEQFHSYLAERGYKITLARLKSLLRKNFGGLTVERDRAERFPRRVFVPNGLDVSWSLDLAFFPKKTLRRLRIGAILVAVDNLSHYIWAVALKNNKAEEVIRGLETIFETGRKPTTILTDQGAELQGYKIRRFLKDKDVTIQTVFQSPNKVALAELSIKLLKQRLRRQLTLSKRVDRFQTRLDKVVQGLNQRKLKRLGWASPVEIDVLNQLDVIERLQRLADRRPADERGLKLGDLVRIQLRRGITGSGPRYSEEIFKIVEVLDNSKPTLFKLAGLDEDETPLQQVWYGRQLALVERPDA